MADEDSFTADPLLVGLTRPAMSMGVTHSFLVVNVVVSSLAFLATKSLPMILIALPLHVVGYVACNVEPRFFDLLSKRLSKVPPVATARYWRCNTYLP